MHRSGAPAGRRPTAQSAHIVRQRQACSAGRIYPDHQIDFYCECDYTPKGTSGGKINADACGYEPRTDPDRGARLEWEHVMPAWFFGHDRSCWTNRADFPECRTSSGNLVDGRTCCARVEVEFRHAEADLHNLVPAVGELNGNRSNLPYGIVDGEPRRYGACDFEIGGSPKVTEPANEVRGDAARIWLYMSETYVVPLTDDQRAMSTEPATAGLSMTNTASSSSCAAARRTRTSISRNGTACRPGHRRRGIVRSRS